MEFENITIKSELPDPDECEVITIVEDIVEIEKQEPIVPKEEPLPEPEPEDVPPDFFDDFSDKNFMAGLDIVDAWDRQPQVTPPGNMDKSDKEDEEEGEIRVRNPYTLRMSRSRSIERYISSVERRLRSSKSNGRYHRSRSPRRYYKSRSRSYDRYRRSYSYERRRYGEGRTKESLDSRRDPEKTRRDINRDKIRCAKDKEMKIVSDKLKIVETGLVPPGTEMDFDIKNITQLSTNEEMDLLENEVFNNKRRSRSIEMRRFSRSPLRRSREFRNSPRRKSPYSQSIERELYMRERRMRMRTPSREPPIEKLKIKKNKKARKKKSFLEEIRDKLNGVTTLPKAAPGPPKKNVSNVAAQPAPVPPPNPVQYYQPNIPTQQQQYDQKFFIGEQYPVQQHMMQSLQQAVPYNMPQQGMITSTPMMNNPMQTNQAPVQIQYPAVNPYVQMPFAPINDAVYVPTNPQPVRENPPVPILQDNAMEAKNADRLFADKKITLTDFLTFTAKPEVSSSVPQLVQKKIQVISRCEEAMKFLNGDRNYTGKLVIQQSPARLPSFTKIKSEIKYQSPLRKIPVVRFQYTTPQKNTDEDHFITILEKTLHKLGVPKPPANLDENDYIIDLGTQSAGRAALKINPFSVVSCEECKKRKSKVFSDVGTQCYNKVSATIDNSTQVTDEDLHSARGFPRNESLAYLTPAQLLGINRNSSMEISPSKSFLVSHEMERGRRSFEGNRGRGGYNTFPDIPGSDMQRRPRLMGNDESFLTDINPNRSYNSSLYGYSRF